MINLTKKIDIHNKQTNRLINIILLILFSSFIIYMNFKPVILATDIVSQEILGLSNLERESRGLRPLSINPKLNAAAYLKAYDMLSKQYWAHYGPSGESPWGFILSTGYDYIVAGENLAYGYEDVYDVHTAWMNSVHHKDNILNNTYKDTGIAVVKGYFEGKDTVIVVQLFGQELEGQEDTNTQENFKMIYPSNNDVIPGSLTGIWGIIKNNNNIKVKIYINGNDQGMAQISTDTFSLRTNYNEYGRHLVESILYENNVQVDKSSANIEIVANEVLPPTGINIENSNQMYNISGLVNDTIEKIIYKNNSYEQICEIYNNEFICKIDKFNWNNNSSIIYINTNNIGNTVDISNILIQDEVIQGESKDKIINFNSISIKSIGSGFIVFLLIVEIFRFYENKKHGFSNANYGYKYISIIVIFLTQYISSGGKII